MKFIILVTLLSVLLHHTSSQSKVNNDVCTVDITNMTIDQLADNPPPGLTTGCVDKNFITKIMAYKEHIHGVLDCLHPDHPVCTKKGYKFVADEIYRRANNDGQCIDCSQRENDLVLFILRLLQKNYPRELRTGLSYLG
ncbi:UNVERIFIED_CONTAM: hypothetical protein RMT77_001288 [Armadillidium vulgare]